MASQYPYVKLDFQADEVRRRVWEGKLYYEFFEGHIMSIELLCDVHNLLNFYENLRKLKSFKELKHVNFLFFCKYEYSLTKISLLKTSAEVIKVYEFFNDSRIPNLRILRD